ncbi:MAG: hypothetical protein WC712_02465 [Candidatus Brocadiia bacterium]
MDNGRDSRARETDQPAAPETSGDSKGVPPDSGKSPVQSTPPDQPERLTFAQKLFFFLVIVFALFLLYMKLFLEKKMNQRTYEPDAYPSFTYNPPEGTWEMPPDYMDPHDHGDEPFEPPTDTYGPENPEGGE